MKLLLWHWGRRGGGVRYTFELAAALKGLCDVGISLSRQSELFDETIGLGLRGWHSDTYLDLTSAVFSSVRLPQLKAQFSEFLERERFDVVIATMHHLWCPAFIRKVRESGAKLIFVVHDADPHPGDSALGWDFMLRREMEGSDRIVALSDHVANKLHDRFGIPTNRISVLPHPAFRFTPDQPRPRQYPSARPIRLVFFGRIRKYKGLELLLDALKQLQAVRPVALTIAGQGSLRPYENRLAKLSSVKLINRWVPENEIAEILFDHDLLIAPYTEASQSGVIPSAYQAGLPVIATPVGGLSEQVIVGETGLLAEAATAPALAAAIERMIVSPALYERCSSGALAAAQGAFGWSKTAEGYLDVCKALVSDALARPSSKIVHFSKKHGVPDKPLKLSAQLVAGDDFSEVNYLNVDGSVD